MKQRLRVSALFFTLVLSLSLFTGCNTILQSEEFLACERIAEEVAKGRDYSKEDVVSAVGKPYYFENNTKGTDYMDAEVTWWKYEVYEFSGYPWQLVLTFDPSGQVSSAEFYATPGG